MLQIHQIPVLRDNYVYIARDPKSGACAAVDPSAADPVLAALDALGWRLTHILNTHHHNDHVGGNLALKEATHCTIIGHTRDASRIPGIDRGVAEGDEVVIGTEAARVIEVYGHTRGHIAYWFAQSHALFCGDTLFSLGCGRLFEGRPEEMWASLLKLRALPDDTKVYCAHEYTAGNAAFALTIDPANPALIKRAAEVRDLRARDLPTVPSTIGAERLANPFLRADDARLKEAIDLPAASTVEAFAEIRRRKDVF